MTASGWSANQFGIGAGALLAAGGAWIKELSSPPYGTAPDPGWRSVVPVCSCPPASRPAGQAAALGMLIAALAAAQTQPAVALIASMVLGAGYGLCVADGLTEVAALAPAHRLARLTSYFWTLAYLGFLAPYVITLCTGVLSPPTVLIAAAVLAVSTLLVIAHRGTRHAYAH